MAHVEVAGDTAVEGDESVVLSLSNVSANARSGNTTAEGLILEDDVEPACVAGSDPAAGALRFSLGGYVIGEQSGTRPNIAVERTGGSAGVAQVTVATSDDTATTGADYSD